MLVDWSCGLDADPVRTHSITVYLIPPAWAAGAVNDNDYRSSSGTPCGSSVTSNSPYMIKQLDQGLDEPLRFKIAGQILLGGGDDD